MGLTAPWRRTVYKDLPFLPPLGGGCFRNFTMHMNYPLWTIISPDVTHNNPTSALLDGLDLRPRDTQSIVAYKHDRYLFPLLYGRRKRLLLCLFCCVCYDLGKAHPLLKTPCLSRNVTYDARLATSGKNETRIEIHTKIGWANGQDGQTDSQII